MSSSGGGGKRSRPSGGGPKTHIPSDFSKRPKAKVGKKARKAANVTDTKFRAASVKVREQEAIGRTGGSADAGPSSDVAAASSLTSLELQSSRGKSLPLLLSTLNHHSSVVRLSSVGGLKDAIAPSRASAAAVRANLNALIPALGRSCCVDDDDEVRKAALELFADVAARVGESVDNDEYGTIAGRSDVASRHLSPYLPLLVAYVTSALNSLDVSIRLDGARAVETLIKVMGTTEVGRPQYVKDMLPAYVRVLVDAKSKGTEDSRPTSGTVSAAAAGSAKFESGKNKKKGKKGNKEKAKESAQNAKSAAVLRSLVLLLKAAATVAASSTASEWEEEEADGNIVTMDLTPSLSQPDLIFVRGGTASNAILAHRTGTAPCSNPSLLSLAALVSESDHQNGGSIDSGNPSNVVTSIEVQVELFGRLRDRLVELSQAGHFVGRGRGAGGDLGAGLCLAQSYLEEMHSLISAVRLIWSMYSRPIVAAYKPEPGKKKGATQDALPKKLRSITGAIHSQFIGMLPLMSGDGGGRSDGNQDLTRYDAANSILCSAVGELGCVLERTTVNKSQKPSNPDVSSCDVHSSVWTNAVFSYVLPRLENDREEEVVDVTILKVVGQLMFGPYLDNDPKRRKELIQRFGQAFFPSGDGRNVERISCISASGRLAAMLLVDLMLKTLPETVASAAGDVHQTRVLVGSMTQVLPAYLMHWEGRFPHETARVLSALLGIVRRYKSGSPLNVDGTVIEVVDEDKKSSDTTEADADPIVLLVQSLRSSIGVLFEQPKKSKKKKGDKESSAPPLRQQSIFESLPNEIQRIILGLFGLLQYPKDCNVNALAKICSRTSITGDAKDYIMDVMYSIRLTLPMQLYLTFLVNSSGLASIKKGTKKKEDATENVENDVQPNEIFAHDIAIERLCRSIVRCGGSAILPMITPLLLSWLGNPADTQADTTLAVQVQRRAAIAVLACMSFDSMTNLDERLKKTTTETSIAILCQKIEDKDDQEQLLAPIVALLMKQPKVLVLALDGLLFRIPDAPEKELQGLIRSLMLILKHFGLGYVLKENENADRLEKVGQAIEKKVTNGPLDRMGGALSTEIQIHIGRNVGGA